ncbi:MAG: DUF2812 domain-containing protein, partial [Clostridia bacterium]|nr:DUF2812 domain-containing protein [Clostridia bacterium]
MAAKKAKKEKNTNTCQSLRIFPGWLTGNEEIFLAQMAGKGWMLDGIYKDTVYHFRRIDPKPKIFAVEFLGKRSAPAEEIA